MYIVFVFVGHEAAVISSLKPFTWKEAEPPGRGKREPPFTRGAFKNARLLGVKICLQHSCHMRYGFSVLWVLN